MKLNKYYLLGVAINTILFALPIYDTSNMFSWTQLGLSFTRSFPVLFDNINPQGFFSLIVFIPIEMIYEYTANMYFTALMLKAIISIFYYLFIFVVYKILTSLDLENKIKEFILCILLFNPMILFVNFIWAEIDIIPVFFVTLSWYLIRFRSVNLKNILISTVSLFISIFFFLYPLVLVPTFIMYTRGRSNRFFLLLSAFVFGLLFLLLSIHVFSGYFYNYVSSLSGTNSTLSPSGLPTGLFYFFHIVGEPRIITEIVLIIVVSIFLPFILRLYNFTEYRSLYIILALFIFISPTINMDNFMFLLPFVFISAVEGSNGTISNKVLYSSLFLTIIPVFFAQFIYSHNGVYGIFYWFYPFLHMNGITISNEAMNSLIIPAYNFFFLLLVFYSVSSLIEKELKNFKVNDINLYHYEGKTLTKVFRNKKFLTLVAIIIVISSAIPISLVYNNHNNEVQLSHPTEFPLLYFYTEKSVNSSIYLPIGANSYSLIGSSLYVPDSDESLLLYRNISNQSFYINSNITLYNSTGGYSLLHTNTWSLQEQLQYNISLIHSYEPSSLDYTNVSVMPVPFLSKNISTYFLNGNQTIGYNLSFSSVQSNTFLLFFKSTRISAIQSLPFYLRMGNSVLELAQYPTFETIAKYSPNTGWSQSLPISYNENAYNWQVISLNYANKELSLSVNGVEFGVSLPTPSYNISIYTGDPIGVNYSFVGYTSYLFSYPKSVYPISYNIAFKDGDKTSVIQKVHKINNIYINFQNIYGDSFIKVNNNIFHVEYSKYLYLQKTGSGSELINITRLLIINDGNGYYMIPAFLVLYYSFAFSLITIYFIVASERRR